MSESKIYFSFAILLIVSSAIKCHASAELYTESNHSDNICALLESKHIATYPWTEYPLVYEPIARGRLTVWSGISTAPTSEFRCVQDGNLSDHMTLNFANFADKYEWTYYDANKGSTLSGISVCHREDVNFELAIDYKQAKSYKECNDIHMIRLSSDNSTENSCGTLCHDCSQNVIELVEGQLQELIRNRFNHQLIDNIYWHLTQLVSNHHFSDYLSLDDDLN